MSYIENDSTLPRRQYLNPGHLERVAVDLRIEKASLYNCTHFITAPVVFLLSFVYTKKKSVALAKLSGVGLLHCIFSSG